MRNGVTISADVDAPDQGDRIAHFNSHLLCGLEAKQLSLIRRRSHPGIDRTGAAMAAFGRADRLVSWVDVCPDANGAVGRLLCRLLWNGYRLRHSENVAIVLV